MINYQKGQNVYIYIYKRVYFIFSICLDGWKLIASAFHLFFFFFLEASSSTFERFLSHKSQPYTFCNAPTQFKSKEKKWGRGSDILRSHTCDPTYPTPLNHTSHKYPHSLGKPLIWFFPFFFLHTTNTSLYHSLIPFHGTHSIAPPPPSFSSKDHQKTP